jgi:hypothetical protein
MPAQAPPVIVGKRFPAITANFVPAEKARNSGEVSALGA